jgi:hypothetical protein
LVFGYDHTGNTGYASLERLTAANLGFSPSTCLRQSPIKPVYCKSCVFAAKPEQQIPFGGTQ